ncbi:crop [Symbiodinium natans]|uniref:Crop protein n=1 Tax=Symbiodinium natans TaxID=878477 RepID=A0A812QYP7_9DINO|nr:crop [Symbiodinium natans]
MLPKVDSDEERHNKKSQQLLDRIGDISMLDRAQDLNVIVDPCRRIEAYNESVWHRAVHVWVFDIEGGRFLIQQRSPKKRHFGGKWNCSTGHIKMGDPALPTAMKSVKDDVGIQDVEEVDFEYLFQAAPCMNEARAMLDALMGPQRDVGKKGKQLSDDWKDKTVCKSFLVGLCPYDKAVLGGIQKRDLRMCSKIHSDIIRDRFVQHADGAEQSETRMEYEDECFNQCEEVLAEFETFSRKELERLKDDPRRRVLSEEVAEKLKAMREEAAFKTKRSEDLDAMALTTGGYNNMSSTLRRQARELSAEADSLQKLEMRKSAEKLQPQACEVCGMGYLDEEEYKAHLTFRVHEGYQQVRDKYEELEKKRAQRARKSKARAKSQPQPSTSQEPPKRAAHAANGEKSVRGEERDLGQAASRERQERRTSRGKIRTEEAGQVRKRRRISSSRHVRSEREQRRRGRRRREDYASDFGDYTEYEDDYEDDDYNGDREDRYERRHRHTRHRRQHTSTFRDSRRGSQRHRR